MNTFWDCRVDAGLGEIYKTLKRCGGSWLVTADHGNAETMIDPVTKGPHTAKSRTRDGVRGMAHNLVYKRAFPASYSRIN
jgi:bisphosphoglycerate-independent phosphoglycerate mutase (AlkP superfamily)